MSDVLLQPTAFRWSSPTPTSVSVVWRRAQGATSYDVRCISSIIRSVTEPTIVIRGLDVAAPATIQVRSVRGFTSSNWADLDVRTTVGAPSVPTYLGTIPLIDADRQSMRLRLPGPDGTFIDCRLLWWWQPSDGGWWASLEVPTNTRVVSSRRMGTNVGLLDGLTGLVAGNIVLRTTAVGGTAEPTRSSFRDGTHVLRWEAA